MRIQRRGIKRDKIYASVELRIRAKIESLARQHDCSKAFVQNTLLGKVLGIDVEERFYDYKDDRKAKRSA